MKTGRILLKQGESLTCTSCGKHCVGGNEAGLKSGKHRVEVRIISLSKVEFHCQGCVESEGK